VTTLCNPCEILFLLSVKHGTMAFDEYENSPPIRTGAVLRHVGGIRPSVHSIMSQSPGYAHGMHHRPHPHHHKMGAFVGHALPGICLAFFGFYLCFLVMCELVHSRAQHRNKDLISRVLSQSRRSLVQDLRLSKHTLKKKNLSDVGLNKYVRRWL